MAALLGETPITTLETVTVAETGELTPPGPLQVSENIVVALTAPEVCVPLGPPSGPFQFGEPEAAQAVALLEFQLKVVEPPGAITVG